MLLLSRFTFSQHWSVKNSGTTANLFEVTFLSDSVGYAVGNDNTNNFILKTTDAGESWTNVSSPIISKLVKAVYFLNKDTGWVVGKQGSVYKTMDGGSIWISKNTGTTFDFNDVWFTKYKNGLAIGKSGNYKTSPDGGSAWATGNLTTTEEYSKLFFKNDTLGYMLCTTDGKTWKTKDAGVQWDTFKTFPLIINDIFFVNTSMGYVIGQTGYVRRTINGGISWNNISPAGYSSKAFSTIFSFGNDIWIGSDSGLVLYTANGGTSWKKDTSAGTEKINSMTFTKNKTGFAVGANGMILKRAVKTTSGINQQISDRHIRVFPNPANDQLNISLDNPGNSEFLVSVTDLNGKVLLSKIYNFNGNRIQIDLDGIKSGMYLLKLMDNNQVISKMFVIQ